MYVNSTLLLAINSLLNRQRSSRIVLFKEGPRGSKLFAIPKLVFLKVGIWKFRGIRHSNYLRDGTGGYPSGF